jgi:hypothetical protein
MEKRGRPKTSTPEKDGFGAKLKSSKTEYYGYQN